MTVLTSQAEAFGLVLVESLACGTPVVASTDGAGPEIVDRPGIGALFDVPEPDAVATTLLGAIDLPDPAAACRARRAAVAAALRGGIRDAVPDAAGRLIGGGVLLHPAWVNRTAR